ncbi:MAG: type I DNA topoisomerase [Candidatus Kerfeldbacteria bacterium]|nr:type I DNA topoisomerase [Candidatus Kerfeldbacteria bacterium]
MKLVIVESPTKAKTIKRFLPPDFVVESSLGHIRDLPKAAAEIPAKYKSAKWARLGVDIEHDFAPLYIIPKDKKKHIDKLKKLIAETDELYLATDEDREGEAISWHLLQVFKPTVPVKRMVFHEITEPAIRQALAQPRDIDMHLVEAQEARRLLDRLYGYEVSPVLWRKVAPKLSAGRVQSAALQLIVEREKQRILFQTRSYWDVVGKFHTKTNEAFIAKLYSLDNQRIASGVDFDGHTGQLSTVAQTKGIMALTSAQATTIAQAHAGADWQVSSVQQKPINSSPRPPFITSTLQQEAGRKLSWPASQTMRTAQRLYEKGYITYMRTDSVTLSAEAIQAARAKIVSLFGADYIPQQPRLYKTKNKTAQEAHEAIRPAGTTMRTVDELAGELESTELKLYELIWKRTVASQMADARLQQTTVQLQHDTVVFQASGRTIEFPGYFRAYVEGADDPEADLTDRETILPPLKMNEAVTADSLTPEEHITKPPARYTEASLVKELETKGIGRPSTYASIIDTIQYRGYVYKEGSALVPRFVAFAVVALLHNNFRNLVDTTYTAAMEEDLDAIATGDKQAIPYLKSFYFGSDQQPGLHQQLQVDIDARVACTIALGKTADGKPVNIRIGRFGPFVELIDGDTSQTASLPENLAPDQLTLNKALEFIEKKAGGPAVLGQDPVTAENIYSIEGRFGPYVQRGDKQITTSLLADDGKNKKKKPKKPKVIKPKMKGLPKGMNVADVTLDIALQLLTLPKNLGVYEKTGADVMIDIGRFGSYIKAGNDTRSIPSTDNILTITLARAIELLDTPKGRGRRSAALKALGDHPTINQPIEVRTGKFGPYLKCGKINVSIPKHLAPDTITLEQAAELVTAKQAK